MINTLLRRPEDRDAADAFYRERVEDTFRRMARIGRDFYRSETRWPDRTFWRARQDWPDDDPAHLKPGDAPVGIAWRSVSAGGFIERQPVVVTADHPRGVWRVAEVPLPRPSRHP